MAYQTGTATDPADLLDKLRAFLLANGWTIEAWRFRTDQPTWRWLALSRAGSFFNIVEDRTFNPGAVAGAHPTSSHIVATYATSYNSANNYNNQAPGGTGQLVGWCPNVVGPFSSYHFFEGVGLSGAYVHVAVELGVGEFRHFGAGVLDKQGTYTGGEFAYGVSWDLRTVYINSLNRAHGIPFDGGARTFDGLVLSHTVVRCAEACALYSLPGEWLTIFGNPAAGRKARAGGIFSYDPADTNIADTFNQAFWAAGPLVGAGVAPLERIHVQAERGGGFWTPIGEVPGMRRINIQFLNPGDELTLGTEVWKVFPVTRKGTGASNIPQSGNAGFAFRRSP